MPRGLPGSVMAYFDVDCPAGSAELRHADWLVYELLRAFVGQRGRNDAPLELGHLPQDGGHRAEHRHQDGATDEASHGRRCVPCDRAQTRPRWPGSLARLYQKSEGFGHYAGPVRGVADMQRRK